jgi:hypothetical protein
MSYSLIYYWNRIPLELQDIIREFDGYYREKMDLVLQQLRFRQRIIDRNSFSFFSQYN